MPITRWIDSNPNKNVSQLVCSPQQRQFQATTALSPKKSKERKKFYNSSLFRHDITNPHRLITRCIDTNPNKNVSTRMLTTAEAVAGNHRVIAKEIERTKEILQFFSIPARSTPTNPNKNVSRKA